jgi:hypothetical protein
MLRELTAFLSLFSLLSLIMGLEGMVFIFGLGAVLLLAADLLLPRFVGVAVREGPALSTRDRVSA